MTSKKRIEKELKKYCNEHEHDKCWDVYYCDECKEKWYKNKLIDEIEKRDEVIKEIKNRRYLKTCFESYDQISFKAGRLWEIDSIIQIIKETMK